LSGVHIFFQIIANMMHIVIVIRANGIFWLYGSVVNVVVHFFVIWELFVNIRGGICVF
jgi:hypothetical protein